MSTAECPQKCSGACALGKDMPSFDKELNGNCPLGIWICKGNVQLGHLLRDMQFTRCAMSGFRTKQVPKGKSEVASPWRPKFWNWHFHANVIPHGDSELRFGFLALQSFGLQYSNQKLVKFGKIWFRSEFPKCAAKMENPMISENSEIQKIRNSLEKSLRRVLRTHPCSGEPKVWAWRPKFDSFRVIISFIEEMKMRILAQILCPDLLHGAKHSPHSGQNANLATRQHPMKIST